MQDYADGRNTTGIPGLHTARYAPVVEPSITAGGKAMTTAALTWLH
ncbi:hypothetical protein [Nocardia sp. NPDC052316]